MQSIIRGFGALAEVGRAEIPQAGRGIVICRAEAGGSSLTFAVDFFDEPRVDPDVAASVDLYFKLQYLRSGYGLDHVVPGGYVQPRPEPHDHFCRLRRLGKRKRGALVYGRFGSRYGQGPRGHAISLLEGRPGLRYRGGSRMVPYTRSLEEAAAAAVCVDLPGRGPFCYRLVDYMAVGACVVAAPHPTPLPQPLQDRRHLVYAAEDLSNLPDLCEWLLDEPEERERIGREAGAYFDRHLHYLPMAGAYLSQISTRLGRLSDG